MRTIGRRIWMPALLLIALVSPAAAQEHPCNVPVPTEPYTLTPGELVRLGFCHPGVDASGQPIVAWEVIGLPTGPFVAPASKVTATPNAQGSFLWETQQLKATAAGQYSVRAVGPGANNVSVPSTPITIALGGLPPPPAPFLSPTGLRLWRQ